MSKGNSGFVPFDARGSGKSVRRGPGKVKTALRLWALSASVVGLATFGCGTQHATLNITAPSSAIVGSPFTIAVTAMVGGSQDRIFNSEIHVTSSDNAAVLPTYYQFTATDAGSHTFPNGVTLMTPGSQTITATVTTSAGITGTTTVTVSAATAAAIQTRAPCSHIITVNLQSVEDSNGR